jgi:hypothetical protein
MPSTSKVALDGRSFRGLVFRHLKVRRIVKAIMEIGKSRIPLQSFRSDEPKVTSGNFEIPFNIGQKNMTFGCFIGKWQTMITLTVFPNCYVKCWLKHRRIKV